MTKLVILMFTFSVVAFAAEKKDECCKATNAKRDAVSKKHAKIVEPKLVVTKTAQTR